MEATNLQKNNHWKNHQIEKTLRDQLRNGHPRIKNLYISLQLNTESKSINGLILHGHVRLPTGQLVWFGDFPNRPPSAPLRAPAKWGIIEVSFMEKKRGWLFRVWHFLPNPRDSNHHQIMDVKKNTIASLWVFIIGIGPTIILMVVEAQG